MLRTKSILPSAVKPRSMVNSADGAVANGAHSLCFYIPSPLHPQAYTRAEELGVDVINPKDPRSKTWWECELQLTILLLQWPHCSADNCTDADAIVWRQGKVTGKTDMPVA